MIPAGAIFQIASGRSRLGLDGVTLGVGDRGPKRGQAVVRDEMRRDGEKHRLMLVGQPSVPV